MSLNNTSGKVITKSQAIELTHAFQSKNPKMKKAYFIGSDLIKKIMGQENCIGIRIYSGLNDKTGETNKVLVGVNSQGEDIVEGVIADELITCPNNCPRKSSLIK